MSIFRNTGGNQFIPHDATREDLMEQIEKGLDSLESWGVDTGKGPIDLGAITINTSYSNDGAISVDVQGDLVSSSEYWKVKEERDKADVLEKRRRLNLERKVALLPLSEDYIEEG